MSENQQKKAIVVLGKMGNGKSSFVKMLAKNPDSVQCSSGTDSCTRDCLIYEVDPVHKLDHGQVYIIDTPGLDSDNKAFLTL